jgi:hypothetical protein
VATETNTQNLLRKRGLYPMHLRMTTMLFLHFIILHGTVGAWMQVEVKQLFHQGWPIPVWVPYITPFAFVNAAVNYALNKTTHAVCQPVLVTVHPTSMIGRALLILDTKCHLPNQGPKNSINMELL